MRADIAALFQTDGIQSAMDLTGISRSEAIQLSIATSLKHIADNLEKVIDYDTFPHTSIAVSQCRRIRRTTDG